MNTKLWSIVAGAVVVVLLGASAAVGGRTMTPMKFSASLNIKQEVPKETGAPATAAGKFTGIVVGGKTLKWTLTFSHLTGKALAAHIHAGAPGKSGPVIIPLCSPCKSPMSGSVKITDAQMTTLSKGKTYVNVHTAKNPNGEIRGTIM
jgi:hypothetical protein